MSALLEFALFAKDDFFLIDENGIKYNFKKQHTFRINNDYVTDYKNNV